MSEHQADLVVYMAESEARKGNKKARKIHGDHSMNRRCVGHTAALVTCHVDVAQEEAGSGGGTED